MTRKATTSSKHYKNKDYLKVLGEHCRKVRVQNGYSVNRMAAEGERLSPSVILRLENGEGSVSIMSIVRYAQVLGIHPKKLLDFKFDLDE